MPNELVSRRCNICGVISWVPADAPLEDCLCERCSRGLECFNDDPDLCYSAGEYLELYQERRLECSES